ncbi:MAG: hypothetical protein ACLQA5_11090, partial [Solirubrobacteraceae bacterium]
GVWIRTTACGALAGVVTGIISVSGRLYTLAGGGLTVVVGVVLLSVAAAVGAPAAASDSITAAVVVMRWVLIISTCLLWLVNRRLRSVRRGRCPRPVEEWSRPV